MSDFLPVRWNWVKHGTPIGAVLVVPPARNTVLVPHLWNAAEFQEQFPYVADVLKGWLCHKDS